MVDHIRTAFISSVLITIFIIVIVPYGFSLPHHGHGDEHGNQTTARKGKADIITTCTFCNILYQGTAGGPGLPIHTVYPTPAIPNPSPNPSPNVSSSTPSSDSPSTGKPDIYLGQPATPDMYPFTVYLAFIKKETETGYEIGACTGSIYTPSTIITAAHCVFMDETNQLFSPDKALVFAGAQQGQRGVRRGVQQIIPHPAYQGWNDKLVNDVALLILSEPYELNDKTIASIDIASDDKLPPNSNCTLSAFGSQTGASGDGSGGSLQQARMVIRQDSECLDAYGTDDFDPNICVCAGGNGLPRQCSGDSGGPLSYKGDDGVLQLYGIVSNSIKSRPENSDEPCSDPRPGVYTRAPSFKAWIDQNAKQ